jgi:hypothetical protein
MGLNLHFGQVMLIEEIEKAMQQKILESFVVHMANLYPEDTGLPVQIWIGKIGGHHGPRIKVSNIPGKSPQLDGFVMSISEEPRVLTPQTCKLKQRDIDDISDWIKLNYDELFKAYKQFETDNQEVLYTLKTFKKLL